MSETNNIDDRLVSWLYGELDESEAARFEDEMSRDPELSAEAESLRTTREMVSQLEDEEPPAALSSFLLHAAAKEVAKAPAGSASDDKPGLWATFLAGFRSLGARPALAAAAALVVVVGVAGVLVSRDGLNMAQESAQSDSVAAQSVSKEVAVEGEAAAVPVTDEEALGDTRTADRGERKDEAASEDEADGDLDAPADAIANNRPEPKAAPEEARVGRLAAATERQALRRQGGGKADLKKRKNKALALEAKPRPRQGPTTKFAQKPGGSKDGFSTDYSNAVSSADPLPKRDSNRGGAPTGGVIGSAGSPSTGRPYAQSQALNDKWAEGELAKLSGKKVKCSRVASVANDILDRNPKFYYKNVAGNKSVTACKWYVAQETTRRSRLRGKKGAGNADSATAAPRRKRRAAPAKAADDAYESAESVK
jgi:hypothetical protein